MRFAFRLWLATRLALVTVVAASVYLWPAVHTANGSVPYGLRFIDGMCPWDCLAYAEIAAVGYARPVMANFWPLFPMLARPLVWLHIPPTWAVVIVANAAALPAFIAVYRVFELIEDEAAARWGLALLVVYPFSFFYGTGYTESIMVLCAAGGMWLALRGYIIWAGALVGAGALSRYQGVLAGFGLALVFWRQHRNRRAIVALAVAALIALLWPLYQWIHFHNPFFMIKMRRAWGWHAYVSVFRGMARASESRILMIQPFWSLVPGVGAIALVTRRRWWPLALIAVPFMAVNWAVGGYGLGRYGAACWPAFLPLGVWLARRPALQLPVIIGFAIWQGMLLQLFAHAYELQ
ncbi:MAG: putative lipoprotein [Myxococcales bacterium]|nr:putative lipoprotein [Myxococcales bacterium]